MNTASTGRIGERIVANELEQRGYRVINLNKDGQAVNADLLVAKAGGKSWQIQVKTHKLKAEDPWAVTYGYTSPEHISGQCNKIFNQYADGFFQAEIVVLVALKSPKEYRCIVMPLETAEKAFQLQLWYWTTPTKKGTVKKPARAWAFLDDAAGREANPQLVQEREILRQHEDKWSVLE
jgi:hypothetical protein